MKSLFAGLLSYFLTPAGLVVLGALDSSLVFFLPLGIDFVVIILTARNPDLFWLYAALATLGAVIGAGVTFWIGRKAGKHGLTKLIQPSRLKRIEAMVSRRGAVTVAALAIVPPPFPFTGFVLTSGAFGVRAWPFLSMMAGVRLARFTIEGALAAKYGRVLVAWMESTTFTIVVGIVAGLAIVGTIVSAIAIARSTRKPRGSELRKA